MKDTIPVLPRNFRKGDYFPGGDVFVDDVWTDGSGTWVDWSDGDCGYVHDESKPFQIAR